MILSLAHCSDAALRSALYEPYPNEDTAVPPSIEEFFGKKDENSSETSVASDKNKATSLALPPNSDDPFSRVDPNSPKPAELAALAFEKAWDLSIENSSALAEALSHLSSVPSSADDSQLDISKLVLSINLKTTRIDRDAGERHLRGELVLEQPEGRNGQAVELVLRNIGPVVYTATPSHDLMQARFRINSKLSLKLELSRYPTFKFEDIKNNPWSGTISIVDTYSRGSKETKVGKITGYVLPLK